MVTDIELFEYPDLTQLDLFLCGWRKSKIYKRKINTREKLLDRIVSAASHIKNVKINLDEQHAIFAHELQSALSLTVGFSNVIVNCNRFII